MRNRAALFFLAAGILLLAALLGGCTTRDSTVAAQSTPDLSVNIAVPYATTTPTVAPTGPASPFTLDASGRVTVLDEKWVDEGFAAADDQSDPDSYYTQLRLGSQGQEVQLLQERLRELKYYSGEITGVFDALTEQAVQLFELTYGTMQTGIATASMQTLLYAETAPEYGSEAYNSARADSFETLQRGDAGSSVLALQYRLQELGYPLANANGQFDEDTAAAVRLVYAEYGLEPSDVAVVGMQQAIFGQSARAYSGAETAQPAAQSDAAGPETLSQGNIGTAVAQIQARLIELGYMSGSASGTFDAETAEAVKRFQSALGYEETGVATGELQTQLLSLDAPAYGSDAAAQIRLGGYALLQEGDAGDAVLRLQNRLVELGYANGTPNGRYAGATTAAVKLFQRALSLEETGVATAALQTLLFADSAPAYAAPASTQAASGDRYYPYNLSMTDLAEGAEGELVVYLQTRMKELGYFEGTADGQYGAATQAAVRSLQRHLGLEETGEASVTLQEHLYSNATPQSNISLYDQTQTFTTMRLGDSQGDVERLQRQLWELGYLVRDDVADSVGTFNQATQAAVIDAQLAMGYVNADGVATPEFQAFLFSKYCTLIKR